MNSEPSGPRILVVDDEEKVRLLLRRCFESEGYVVVEAGDGAAVHKALSSDAFDLITLDLNLGHEDGLTIARDIRAMSDVPIVMVTGKGDLIDTVVGLEVGADDYIAKPFHLREVLARVRSVLRRSELRAAARSAPSKPDSSRYRFDRWVADFAQLELRDDEGRTCDLTSGEFNLLEVFVKNPRRVLTREALMDSLKGEDWAANDRSIDNQVARLRKKIERNPSDPQIIKTVRGAGYTLTVSVAAE